MPNKKVPPSSGKEFISVYSSDWSSPNTELNQGVDETFSMECAVTHRSRYAPIDRRGEELYVVALTSMEARCRELIGLIDKNYILMAAANDILLTTEVSVVTRGGDTIGGRPVPGPTFPGVKTDRDSRFYKAIIEPFRWTNTTPSPEEVGPEHFYYDGDWDSDKAPAGFVMTVHFNGARRLHHQHPIALYA